MDFSLVFQISPGVKLVYTFFNPLSAACKSLPRVYYKIGKFCNDNVSL